MNSKIDEPDIDIIFIYYLIYLYIIWYRYYIYILQVYNFTTHNKMSYYRTDVNGTWPRVWHTFWATSADVRIHTVINILYLFINLIIYLKRNRRQACMQIKQHIFYSILLFMQRSSICYKCMSSDVLFTLFTLNRYPTYLPNLVRSPE